MQSLPLHYARWDHSDLLREFATSCIPRFEIDQSGDSLINYVLFTTQNVVFAFRLE